MPIPLAIYAPCFTNIGCETSITLNPTTLLLSYALCTLLAPSAPKSPVKVAKTVPTILPVTLAEQPRVRCGRILPCMLAIYMHAWLGLHKKETPLENSFKTDLFWELVYKTNPIRSICSIVLHAFRFLLLLLSFSLLIYIYNILVHMTLIGEDSLSHSHSFILSFVPFRKRKKHEVL